MVINSSYSLEKTLATYTKIAIQNPDMAVENLTWGSAHIKKYWQYLFSEIGGLETNHIIDTKVILSGRCFTNGYKNEIPVKTDSLIKLNRLKPTEWRKMVKGRDPSLILEVNKAFPTCMAMLFQSESISIGSKEIEEFYKATVMHIHLIREFILNPNRKVYRQVVYDVCGCELSEEQLSKLFTTIKICMNVTLNSLFGVLGGTGSVSVVSVFSKEPIKNLLESYCEVVQSHKDLIETGYVDIFVMKDRHSLLVLSTRLKEAGFGTKYSSISKGGWQ